MDIQKVLSIVLVMVSFFAAGCTDSNNPSSGNKPVTSFGSVKMEMLRKTIPNDVALIQVELHRTGYQDIKDSVSVTNADTVQMTIGNIPEGDWVITVNARGSSGVLLYTGAATTHITEGTTTDLIIELVKVPGSGVGSLRITIRWNIVESKWNLIGYNAVLRQSPGGFDENHYCINQPYVIKVGNLYQMWYTSASGRDTLAIATATSVNGENWEKNGFVKWESRPANWAMGGYSSPAILYENGMFRMWFSGDSAKSLHSGIGYAISQDGITWSARSTPVIPSTQARPKVFSPKILKINNQYFLFYNVETQNSPQLVEETHLATSFDGIVWSLKGPVLQQRSNVSWDVVGPIHPSVIYDEQRFKMYYTAFDPTGYTFAIGYAESLNGYSWAYTSATPEFTTANTDPWFTKSVGYVSLLRDGTTLKMWFSAISVVENKWQIGLAKLH